MTFDSRGKNPKTVSRAFYALRRFQGWLEELGIDPTEVDERRLKQYVAYLRSTVANSSARSETEKVKAAYRYALRIGTITKNPAEYVETPSLDDHEPETYTNEDLRRIRAAIIDDLRTRSFTSSPTRGCAGSSSRRRTCGGTVSTFRTRPSAWSARRGSFERCLSILGSQRCCWLAKRTCGEEAVLVGRELDAQRLDFGLRSCLNVRASMEGIVPRIASGRPSNARSMRRTFREDVIDSILGWAPKTVPPALLQPSPR